MNSTGGDPEPGQPANAFDIRSWLSRLMGRRGDASASGPCVLAVVEEGPAREAVAETARREGWVLEIADSLKTVLETQRAKRHAVVVYQRELPGIDWREAVSICAGLAGRPCVILLSRLTDHNLWVELARHGGSDLLREPVQIQALGAAVHSAWSLWQTQQKLLRRADPRGHRMHV